jgi:hemoglobin-like flavoprotein
MTKSPSARAPSKVQLEAAEQWLNNIQSETASLIQFAWDSAVASPGDFAADFYDNLFKAAPSVIGLFAGDMTEQQGRLTHTLGETVALVDKPAHLLLLLRASGVRHHHYDVKQVHFGVMRDILIDTIAFRVGASFETKHRSAWEALFDNMATIMQHGMASAAKK